MARGIVSKLHPPGNNGSRQGAGKITPESGGKDIVFQTPRDVAPGTILSEGMSIVYDSPDGKTITNIQVALPVCELTSNVEAVGVGGAVTLSWTSQFATSLSIDNGVGNVSPLNQGSVVVHPELTTTYTLTAVNPSGSATSSVDITVVRTFPGGGGPK